MIPPTPPQAGQAAVRSTEQFWQWLAPQLPRYGITRVADVTGLDNLGVPVCVAIRPASRALSVSQGKGLSLAQAQVSAAMESIETWHAERVRGELFQGTPNQARAEGLNLAALQGFAHRPTTLPLDDTPTVLAPALHYLSGERVWVPLDAISTNFCFELDAPPVFMRSSSGLAAGASYEAALMHGMGELVERDTVQRWLLQGGLHSPARRLHPGVVGPLDRLLERCAALGIAVFCWDLSAGAALPCFGVMLLSEPAARDAREVGAFGGYGSHPDPGLALQAALLEAVQSRLTLISGARDDLFRHEFERCRNPDFHAQMWQRHADASALQALPPAAPPPSARELAQALEAHYRQPLYWLDLSEPDSGLVVVRTLMPGLQQLGMESRYYCQSGSVA